MLGIDHSADMTILRFMPDDSTAYRALRAFSLVLFVLSGLLSYSSSRCPRLPRLTAFLLATMLAYSGFWCIMDFSPSEYWPELIGARSPLVFVMCLGIYSGFDPTLTRWLRPTALAIAYASAALGAYYARQLPTEGHLEGQNPAVEHLQAALWFGLYALAFRKSSRWRDCVPSLLPLGVCVGLAVSIASRSFVLLATIALVLGILLTTRLDCRSLSTRLFISSALTTLVVAGLYWILMMAAPERFGSLNARLTEDTRTSQYSQFFQQIPPHNLLVGCGPKAAYTYNGQPNYEYIDNQFLYLLFKFGAPVVIGYFAVVLWPGLRHGIAPAARGSKLTAVIFWLWTLAGLGISVYHNISLTAPNLLIILLAGTALASHQATDHQTHRRTAAYSCSLTSVKRNLPSLQASIRTQ